MNDPDRRILEELTRPTFLDKPAAEELLNELRKRQRALGYLVAQAEMQARVDASIREVQANAWDDGYAAGQTDYESTRANPYRRGS